MKFLVFEEVSQLELKAPEELKNPVDIQKHNAAKNITHALIGISVGIPSIKGREPKQYQYKINLIKYRELEGLDAPDETDDTIED